MIDLLDIVIKSGLIGLLHEAIVWDIFYFTFILVSYLIL